jgi:hypothetical protein
MKIDNKSSIEYLTLLSSDATSLEALFSKLTNLVLLPTKTTIVLVILIRRAGFASVFASLMVFAICSLFLASLSKFMVNYRLVRDPCKSARRCNYSPGFKTFHILIRKELAAIKDERTCITSEVLNGIKVIKMNSWENSFKNMIIPKRM